MAMKAKTRIRLPRLAWMLVAATAGWHCAATDAQEVAGLVAEVRRVPAQGIENFYQLSRRIYSGSAPAGEAAFAELQARGIKTIITVDGAQPEVETARKYGLRYVHLPVGYDGISPAQAVRLVQAAESLPGPVFVHCHHGLHRGPAGAAVICMGLEAWTPEQAVAWLRRAGTATNYAGLYSSVRQFHPPSPAQLRQAAAEFPERAKLPPLAEVMVRMDQRLDALKAIQAAGRPDLDAQPEALQLAELFKELLRDPALDQRGAGFQELLTRAGQASLAFHRELQSAPARPAEVATAFKRLTESCTACHQAHRN